LFVLGDIAAYFAEFWWFAGMEQAWPDAQASTDIAIAAGFRAAAMLVIIVDAVRRDLARMDNAQVLRRLRAAAGRSVRPCAPWSRPWPWSPGGRSSRCRPRRPPPSSCRCRSCRRCSASCERTAQLSALLRRAGLVAQRLGDAETLGLVEPLADDDFLAIVVGRAFVLAIDDQDAVLRRILRMRGGGHQHRQRNGTRQECDPLQHRSSPRKSEPGHVMRPSIQ
jgi:hypothetical protein